MHDIADAPARVQDRLADFTRDRRVLLLASLAAGIGALATVVAYALVWLIGAFTNLAYFQQLSPILRSPAEHRLGWWAVGIPVLGGLAIGLMARFGSEKIRGHGIPEALEAILFGRSRMDPKVTVLKPLSSAISIGTGGPFGAEGPIIMTGGALGSLVAQLFHLSPAERKTLLVAGAAGGMTAIFATPVAAVLLAVELLLFEWRPRSFIPVAAASAVAAGLRVPIFGAGAIFPVAPHAALGMEGLLFAALAGVFAGLGSGVLTALVYAFEDLFAHLPIHWMWWPAIGGLAVGIGGQIDPRVLGVGYETIHGLLRGEVIGAAVVSLVIAKSLVWSCSLGSGTSGGVLAPLLMMGAALGALESRVFPVGDAGLWAVIGMAAMMGGTMRSPLTAMIFTLELTHDMDVLPGLLAACTAAHAVTVLLLRRSILTEKVARRGYHVTREYAIDPLATLRVSDAMDRDVPTIPGTMTVTELADLVAKRDPRFVRRQGTLIVDEGQRLAGIITRGDLVRALEQTDGGRMSVLDAGSRSVVVAFPDETLLEAVDKMLRNDIGRMPVVAREDGRRIVGYVGRATVMKAHLGRHEEERISGDQRPAAAGAGA